MTTDAHGARTRPANRHPGAHARRPPLAPTPDEAAAAPPAKGAPRRGSGAGAATTAIVAVAAFLAVLVVLALQLRSNPGAVGLTKQRPRVVIVRRIYQTTIHERIIGAGGGGGTTIQSSQASVSGPAVASAAPVSTHTS